MMQHRVPNWMILWTLLLSLGGCVGTVSIGGGPGDDDDTTVDDDDDDDVPDLDFSVYEGDEYLNIRWDPEQAPTGHVDCQERFAATGEMAEPGWECESCDVVWAVTLESFDPEQACLGQGTSLEVPSTYQIYVGMDFREDGEFFLYRSALSSDDELTRRGVGAFNNIDFSWSGVGGWEEKVPANAFTLFYSGEGGF